MTGQARGVDRQGARGGNDSTPVPAEIISLLSRIKETGALIRAQ
jgi:hypothetical protein